MVTRSTLVTVSEPTMHGGIWTLAQFRWRALSRFTDQDIEETGTSALTVMLQREMSYLKDMLDDWLLDLPEVDEWCERLHQGWQHDYPTDTYSLRATASGWFSLSDDEEQTKRMLELVDCETVGGMRARLFEARIVLRESSLLRPGSANNDINPIDFTNAPLHHRTRYVARWDAAWSNWRGLYGRLEDSQRDASDALRYMIDAARAPPPVDPVHPESRQRALETYEAAAAQMLNEAFANHPVDERLPGESSEPTLPDTTSSDGGGT